METRTFDCTTADSQNKIKRIREFMKLNAQVRMQDAIRNYYFVFYNHKKIQSCRTPILNEVNLVVLNSTAGFVQIPIDTIEKIVLKYKLP